MTPFPFKVFSSIEAPKIPNSIPRNPPSHFFISYFIVLLTPLTNTLKFSSDFMVLIISFIFTFLLLLLQLLTHSFSLIAPSITKAGAIVANGVKKIAKGKGTFNQWTSKFI